jgi:hypothetical protein
MHSAICWKTRVSVRYSFHTQYVSSDNLDGAENQQERLRQQGWVIGFVDGEGCFSIGLVRQNGGPGRCGYRTGMTAKSPGLSYSESSEAIRRTSRTLDDEMVPSAWRHAGRTCQGRVFRSRCSERAPFKAPEVRFKRNSLSGKNYLPRRFARSGRVPAHIGEALPTSVAGNPEGSPRHA